MKPTIGLSRIEATPEDFFDEFSREIASSDVDLEISSHGATFMGMEWFMPTAIFVVLTRSYFDAIFSEMGKEHYKVLKRGLRALHRRAAALPISRTGTKGKISSEPIYSPAFSIVVDMAGQMTFKLLLQPGLPDQGAEKALEAFLDLVASIADGTISPQMLDHLAVGRVVGRTLLLAYDFDAGSIVTVNPMPQAPHG